MTGDPRAVVGPAWAALLLLAAAPALAADPAPPLQQVRNPVQTRGTPDVPGRANSVAMADFNGDGELDAAVTTYWLDWPAELHGVSILLGEGAGRFTPGARTTWDFSPYLLQTIVAGDFNEDGRKDLAVLAMPYPGDAPFVILLLGQGDGTFAESLPHIPLQTPLYQWPSPSERMAVEDFDKDGHEDIAVACTGTGQDGFANLEVLYGSGSGTFTSTAYPGVGAPYIKAIAKGDFNADGWTDVAAAGGGNGSNSGIVVYLNDRAGGFEDVRFINTGKEHSSLAAGDTNGDGHVDLVSPGHGGDESAWIYRGAGDGTFPVVIPLPHALFARDGTKGMDVAIADMNRDGHADLVFGSEGAASPVGGVWEHGALFILPGDGAGNFKGVGQGGLCVELPSVPLPHEDFTCYDIDLADLDGDGDPDILAGTDGREGLEAFLNRLWKDVPQVWMEPDPTLEGYQPYAEVAFVITDAQGAGDFDPADPECLVVLMNGHDVTEAVKLLADISTQAGGRVIRLSIAGVAIPPGAGFLVLVRDREGNLGVGGFEYE